VALQLLSVQDALSLAGVRIRSVSVLASPIGTQAAQAAHVHRIVQGRCPRLLLSSCWMTPVGGAGVFLPESARTGMR